MREELTAELLEIVRAVRILSPVSFSWAGKIISAGQQPPETGEQNPLMQHLGRQLYLNCYSRRFSARVTTEQPSPKPDDDFVSELCEANTSREYADPGWLILRVLPADHLIVEKNGLIRLLAAGEFISHDGDAALTEGRTVSIRWPKESKTMHPGFYYIYGEAITDQQDDHGLLRFYWNVKPEGAKTLVRLLTERLNRFQVAFRLKCLNEPAAYTRADAAVLYLNKRFYRLAAELLADVYREVENYLAPQTPLFSRELAAGLGLAEEPGTGESFGQQRCRILAQGICRAYELNLQTDEERLAEIINQFELNGLSLDRPHLNAGSTDEYEFSLTPEKL